MWIESLKDWGPRWSDLAVGVGTRGDLQAIGGKGNCVITILTGRKRRVDGREVIAGASVQEAFADGTGWVLGSPAKDARPAEDVTAACENRALGNIPQADAAAEHVCAPIFHFLLVVYIRRLLCRRLHQGGTSLQLCLFYIAIRLNVHTLFLLLARHAYLNRLRLLAS